MGGQNQKFSESIDDVLTAVQETPRGRWFLEAYAARLKSEGTANILGAIAKLENNLERLSGSGASAELLDKARNAIANARQEIANLEPQTVKLSTEAQLFANLADLSRKAFSAETANSGLGKGVQRALKLVSDLDRDLNPTTTFAPEVAQIEFTAPPKPATQYFKQDDEIFEPAPAVVPNLVKPVELVETPNRGAKLTIRRMTSDKPAIEAVQTVAEPAAPSAPVVEAATPEPSRIVIIRRKADETLAVPLLEGEEQQAVSAA